LRHFYASWCINRVEDGGLGWNPGNDALVGNNASVGFRERDEDEYPRRNSTSAAFDPAVAAKKPSERNCIQREHNDKYCRHCQPENLSCVAGRKLLSAQRRGSDILLHS
jgi:hypothetical protein